MDTSQRTSTGEKTKAAAFNIQGGVRDITVHGPVTVIAQQGSPTCVAPNATANGNTSADGPDSANLSFDSDDRPSCQVDTCQTLTEQQNGAVGCTEDLNCNKRSTSDCDVGFFPKAGKSTDPTAVCKRGVKDQESNRGIEMDRRNHAKRRSDDSSEGSISTTGTNNEANDKTPFIAAGGSIEEGESRKRFFVKVGLSILVIVGGAVIVIAIACGAPTQCVQPDSTPNGNMSCTDGPNSRNMSCVLKCSDGFHVMGRSTIFCVNGKWNSSLPSCEFGACHPLSKPQNGTVSCIEDSNWNKKCTFDCDDGFKLTGNDTIFCKEGNWTDLSVECKRDCLALPVVNHGYYTCTNEKAPTLEGSECNPTCTNNHQIQNGGLRRCQANGTWTGAPAKCVCDPCRIGERCQFTKSWKEIRDGIRKEQNVSYAGHIIGCVVDTVSRFLETSKRLAHCEDFNTGHVTCLGQWRYPKTALDKSASQLIKDLGDGNSELKPCDPDAWAAAWGGGAT